MCGIVGYAGNENVIEKLKFGLKRLEYRGYDSAGVSFFCGKKLKTIKSVGSVDCLFNRIKNAMSLSNDKAKKQGQLCHKENQKPQKLFVGIGHTRWATHGPATENNSHPHQSEHKYVSLVHNGIIENYQALKDEFLPNTKFDSETDTEVIANLLEQELFEQNIFKINTNKVVKISKYRQVTDLFNSQLSPAGALKRKNLAKPSFDLNEKLDAIKTVTEKLKGSYALAILFSDDPKRVFFAKQTSPLLIGLSKNSNFLASDILGFDDSVDKFIEANDGQFGWISSQKVEIFDKNGKKLDFVAKNIKSNANDVNLCGFAHYMEKEIYEIPKSIMDTCLFYSGENSPLLNIKKQAMKRFSKTKRIYLVACGTSFHTSKVGEIWLRQLGFDATAEIASEFLYSPHHIDNNTLCIFTSQSGETADTLSATRLSKKHHSKTLCITNVETSTLAKLCDIVLPIKCGPEIAVASTKAYNAQLCTMKILANFLKIFCNDKNATKSEKLGKKTQKQEKFRQSEQNSKNLTKLENLQKNIKKMQKNIKKLANLSKKINFNFFKKQIFALTDIVLNSKKIFMLGKNFDYVLALESALKLKEISYLSAEAYPSGELKHGTISLIDQDTLVFAFATEKNLTSKTMNIVEQVHSRGAKVVLVSPFDWLENSKSINYFLQLPKVAEEFYPIVSIIPMQLLAYNVSVKLGNNPDKPRNLAKSVTVE